MQSTMMPYGPSESQRDGNRPRYPDDTALFVRRFAPRGRDPAVADENLYRYCGNEPTDATDPTGTTEHFFDYIPGRFDMRGGGKPQIAAVDNADNGSGILSAHFQVQARPKANAFVVAGKKLCERVGFVQIARKSLKLDENYHWWS
jgi:hypothetical protein